MGVIRRQGSKQFAVHLVGVLLGAISTVFIYPHDTEIYGSARFMLDTALFLSPFVLLGVGHLPVKFYPHFRNIGKNHGGYLSLLMVLTAVSCAIFLLLLYIFKGSFYNFFSDKDPFFLKYGHFLIPLSILTALVAIYSRYTSNFKRITIPYILTNLLQKAALPIIVLAFILGHLTELGFVWSLLIMLSLSLIGLLIYLAALGELRFGRIDRIVFRKNIKEMMIYAGYGMLGGVGSALATRIDSIMVSSLVDLSSNGAYNIGAFMANVIAAPLLAVATISGPIIASSWQDGDHSQIKKIFKDASSVLLVVGIGFFLMIVFAVDDLIRIFPDRSEFEPLYWVVFFIGLAKLFDLASSVNNEIILYSKYFRFNLIAVLALGFLNIFFNYLFIKTLSFGMLGAALGTAASLFIYNMIKLIFIYVRFGMQPFTTKSVWIVLLGVGVFVLGSLLPLNFSPWINIFVKASIVLIAFYGLTFVANLSQQYSDLVRTLLVHLRLRK